VGALATLLCAATAIAAAVGLLPAHFLFVFKPLTTVLVVVHAWRRDGGAPIVRRAVLFGLVLSLAGDVALLWPQQGFLPGLVAFLLAHLAYLLAFTRRVRLAARRWPFVAYAAIAGAVLSQLWPGVPAPLRVPVIAYVLCLAAMAPLPGLAAHERPTIQKVGRQARRGVDSETDESPMRPQDLVAEKWRSATPPTHPGLRQHATGAQSHLSIDGGPRRGQPHKTDCERDDRECPDYQKDRE